MKVIGYGEDALTYWAIMNKLPEIAMQLNEKQESIKLALFRPSFGRKGSVEDENGKQRVGPEFGEFDAILCSENFIYLIETKWTKSSEVKDGEVKLGQPQRTRHKVMAAYIDEWNLHDNPDQLTWSDFNKNLKYRLETNELIIDVAPEGSRLARNMQHILRMICSNKRTAMNVILFVRMKHDQQSTPKSREDYKVVDIACDCDVSGFVDLHTSK